MEEGRAVRRSSPTQTPRILSPVSGLPRLAGWFDRGTSRIDLDDPRRIVHFEYCRIEA